MTTYNSRMKATLKSVAAALTVLALVLSVLTVLDRSAISASAKSTNIRVSVVDLDNNPVHNAQVTVCGQTFYTDNKGVSPVIELIALTNSYDETVTEWGTATVAVTKEGFVPAIVFNCVCYSAQTRKLTVKIYRADESELSYVSYVESPPDGYIQSILPN